MQPAISEKRRSELSRVGEKDRGDARAGYEAEESRRRERGQESQRAMKDKRDGGASLFLHQIVDFTPAPAPAQPVLSRTFHLHTSQSQA